MSFNDHDWYDRVTSSLRYAQVNRIACAEERVVTFKMNMPRRFEPQIPVAIIYGTKGLSRGKYAAKALPPEQNGKNLEIPVIVMPHDNPETSRCTVILGRDPDDPEDC